LVVAVAAIGLRLPRLAQRPMHGDEAIGAVKFGLLLEEGSYRYDPYEYHGPTLNYFTLPSAWLNGIDKFKNLNEFTLRIVPVFFGVLLVLMTLLLTDGMGRSAVIIAAIFTAVSPAFVYYSRYYVHEMLLACFTFGVIASGWRYSQSKNVIWAIMTGLFIGLMHATKETCVIALGSMLFALLLTVLMRCREDNSIAGIKKIIKTWHILIVLVTALIVSALFFSSFFTNPQGVADSFTAYKGYFQRAGQNQLHIHPWYYYIRMLLYWRYGSGPVWSEAVIVLLAIAGLSATMARKGISTDNIHLLRFVGFYTVVMTVLYSIIPYKTPWCLLGFLHGMILLAAVGAVAVVRLSPNIVGRVIVGLLLAASTAALGWQSYLACYKYYADPVNPYVYAHPGTDVFAITRRVEDIASVHPDGHNMHIDVICPGDDYWPLPWYLRRFGNVGWWNKVDEDTAAAPVIIASADVESALVKKLYELPPPGQRRLYVPLFDTYMLLRPKKELRGYVTKELWDSYQVQSKQRSEK